MTDHHPLSFLDQDKRGRTTSRTSVGPVPARSVCPRRSIERGPQGAGQTETESIPEHRPRASDGEVDAAERLEATWAELERLGRETGHVVARCPSCQSRAMVSILNGSGTSRWVRSGGGWPKCKVCLAGRGKAGVRVEPVGDVALVRRLRPGHNPTARGLASRPPDEGFEWRPRPEAKGTA